MSPVLDCSPNNVFIPDEFLSNISIYFTPPGDDYNMMEEKLFRSYVRKFLIDNLNLKDREKILPYSLEKCINRAYDELGTKSAGYPYCCSKGRVIKHYSSQLKERIGFFRNMSYPEGDGPFIAAFLRTQAHGKMRLVLGYPLEANIVEAQYLRPIVDRITSRNRLRRFFNFPIGVKS